jgi:hypothetical protein
MLYRHKVIQRQEASTSPPVPKSGYVQCARYSEAHHQDGKLTVGMRHLGVH